MRGPVVAAVNGFCLGPGMGLVGNADVIVAAEGAGLGPFPGVLTTGRWVPPPT
ncbi:MAG: hypothetical protein CM1200mP26_12380 [Acidimicrobiales bacterium]|nr:MAG: hypothetical protein CM1200mP26_12380 [Acidimicrobiales bacterium]